VLCEPGTQVTPGQKLLIVDINGAG